MKTWMSKFGVQELDWPDLNTFSLNYSDDCKTSFRFQQSKGDLNIWSCGTPHTGVVAVKWGVGAKKLLFLYS